MSLVVLTTSVIPVWHWNLPYFRKEAPDEVWWVSTDDTVLSLWQWFVGFLENARKRGPLMQTEWGAGTWRIAKKSLERKKKPGPIVETSLCQTRGVTQVSSTQRMPSLVFRKQLCLLFWIIRKQARSHMKIAPSGQTCLISSASVLGPDKNIQKLKPPRPQGSSAAANSKAVFPGLPVNILFQGGETGLL